jgi:VIT1/CCC1 family predicted Fe2+/Mn2+ transporter
LRAASFLGAALPLLAGTLLPGPAWLAVALALAALAGLGVSLARVLDGRRPARRQRSSPAAAP